MNIKSNDRTMVVAVRNTSELTSPQLIEIPSRARSPVAPVRLRRSEPAKSTKLNFAVNTSTSFSAALPSTFYTEVIVEVIAVVVVVVVVVVVITIKTTTIIMSFTTAVCKHYSIKLNVKSRVGTVRFRSTVSKTKSSAIAERPRCSLF